MIHEHTSRARYPSAWRGSKLETNLPSMQRDAKKQTRRMPERDNGTSANIEGVNPFWSFGMELSQLRMGWYRR